MSPRHELDARRERAATNQSRFREVNERIEELDPVSSFVEFVCECAQRECTKHVALTAEEYERVRRNPNHFFVLSGHEDLAVEEIVARSDRWVVVAKLGAGAAVAEQLDPRQRLSE